MSDDLSHKYLLYLRDTSRQILFSNSSGAGNYSKVLVEGRARKKNKNRTFSRITDYSMAKLESKSAEAYRADINLQGKGFGLFCSAGILCGSYLSSRTSKKKGRSGKSFKTLAAPVIYGRIIFEDNGECDINEWIINYDLATCFYTEQFDESQEIDYLLNEDKVSGSNTIREIEDVIEGKEKDSLQLIKDQADIFVEDFSKVAETKYEIVDTPLDAVKLGLEAVENKEKRLYYCKGDWIFNAPIPDGLNTYTALEEIAKELANKN